MGEWNTILFTAFIPQAWTYLLLILARDDRVKDIFQYWPPPGDSNDYVHPMGSGSTFGSGGAANAATTTRKPPGTLQTVFDCVIIAKPAVWPVYAPVALPSSPLSPRSAHASLSQSPGRPHSSIPSSPKTTTQAQAQSPAPPPDFAELGTLKIARDNHLLDLRNALAECGIRFTNPPDHFKGLIEGSKERKFEFLEPENVYEELLVRLF